MCKKRDLAYIKTKIREIHYLEDETLLEFILAILVSRKQTHARIWTIVVGDSSDGKSQLIKLVQTEDCRLMSSFNARTLISGRKNAKNDLAPKLHNKIMVISEMAEILSAEPKETRQIVSQLRKLHDGEAIKDSADTSKSYEGLHVNFIGCTTGVIDRQYLIHQNLGTREVIFRTRKVDEEKLMQKVEENNKINKEEKIKEINQEVRKYIKETSYQEKEIRPEIISEIKEMASSVCKLRATGDINKYSGEVEGEVYEEKPGRILEQFLVIYKSLLSLDKNYPEERALEILYRLCKDCPNPTRLKVVMLLLRKLENNDEGLTQRQVANELRIAKNTAYANLNILYALDIVEKNEILINAERDIYKYSFRINKDSKVARFLAKKEGIQLVNQANNDEVIIDGNS